MRKISLLVLSDIHLGHDVNKTEDIIHNLQRFFKTYDRDIKLLDMIVISGDIFDQLLPSNGFDMNLIYLWLIDLVKLCDKYGISLRVLEGTPGHDWKQFKLLYDSILKLDPNIDIKYFDELTIEYDEVFRKHILYIPDEWKPTAEEIYEDAKLKIKKASLKQVDIAIMHGAFSYQLPDFIENTLDPEKFIKLVKGPIIIGHVHKHSIYKNIVVPGSFEALTHDDDYRKEKKGAVLVTINENDKFTVKFLQNKYALKFITIPIHDKSLEDITKVLNKYKNTKIRVRLLIENDSQLTKNIKELKHKYPDLHISFKKNKSDSKETIINKSIRKLDIVKLDKHVISEYIEKKEDTITHDKLISMLEDLK